MAGYCENQSKNGKSKKAAPLSAVVVLAVVLLTGAGSNSSSGSQVIDEGAGLVITISEISETAKFFPVTADGTKMEIVAVTAPDGTIRTAFNTCQVCNGSPRAYFEQRGNTLECQACRNRFPMNLVGIEAGGCNPAPIFAKDRTETAETITVSYETLGANAYLFPQNWKKQ